MPVHLESYEPDVDLTPDTAKSDIVAFLYNNAELGFKPKEIEDSLALPHGTVTNTLRRLHEDGFVGKTTDSHYHALEHRDDLHRYVSSLDQVDRLFEDRDFEENTDWGDNPPEDPDEDELDAELDELENDIDA